MSSEYETLNFQSSQNNVNICLRLLFKMISKNDVILNTY